MAEEYGGVLGAFPYAFRVSDSLLFRSYVVVGGLVALLVSLLVVLAIVVLFGNTAQFRGGSLTLSRAFFAVFGLGLVAPLLAPTLLVARRHRRRGSTPRYDRWIAVAGYLFVLSLYLGAVASMPESFVLDGETETRPAPSGLFAPVVAALYAIPPQFSWTVPLAAALVIVGVHYALRD
jgi:hypothetical protein